MNSLEKKRIIENAQKEPVLMPDGGYCCLEMTEECYGCSCYGTGNTTRCKQRVQEYFSKLEDQ